jgi:two-component system phosphate regulon response regulator PhoB
MLSPGCLHPSRPGETAPRAADAAPTLGRVLLVDDEAAIRESLTEALEEAGFQIVNAANGREALEVLRNSPRSLTILLDLTVPTMDGLDLRREQLNDPQLHDIPLLIVGASGSLPETNGIQLGHDGLIAQSVPCFELLASLGRALLAGLSSVYGLDD